MTTGTPLKDMRIVAKSRTTPQVLKQVMYHPFREFWKKIRGLYGIVQVSLKNYFF
jgi:hypothetical protein